LEKKRKIELSEIALELSKIYFLRMNVIFKEKKIDERINEVLNQIDLLEEISELAGFLANLKLSFSSLENISEDILN
jgi:hypothetical protein